LAYGDVAAGRAAYDKGDYARAMSEWQSAADHGDAEAQFGLGSLYELGGGDLKQDYKRADYWYEKAAKQDYVEAEYRLALIWAAGSSDFPADLAEAYKWASLATESKGVWGSLAADLKAQLDKVISALQQAEGKKRAAAWKEALNAPKEIPTPLVPQAPSPLAKPGATGCPGWPFPTLPCTEQFPPLPGSHAAAAPVVQPTTPSPTPKIIRSPLEQLNDSLVQIECAALRARTSAQGAAVVSGTVPNVEERSKLVQLAGQFFPNTRPEIKVEIVPPPLCRSLSEIDALRVAGLITEGDLSIRLNNGAAVLHEGDPMRIEVRSPAYPVSLRIDYFSIGGQVLHLWPTGNEPTPRIAAAATHVFGDPVNGKVVRAGGAPFGTELILIVGTPSAIELGSRPAVEKAADYLRDLKQALARMNRSPDKPNLFAELLVRTAQ
jgi:hypothetical protein